MSNTDVPDVPLEIARIVVPLPNGGNIVGYGLRYDDQDGVAFREVVATTARSMAEKACAAPSEIRIDIVHRDNDLLPFALVSVELLRANLKPKEEVYHTERVPYGQAPHLPDVPDRFTQGGRKIPESEIN